MKKSFLLSAAVLVIIVAGILLVTAGRQSGNTNSDAIQVGTSIYPLEYLITEIGGEYVELTVAPTPGVDVHSFEPSARDIARLQEADLFVFHGAELDTWAEDAAENLPETVTVLEATSTVDLLATAEEETHDDHDHEDEADGHDHEEHTDEEEHEEDAHDDHHDHAHGEFDPHVWFDPIRMIKIAEEITHELSEIDPENATEFETNFARIQTELLDLDEAYSTQLESCKSRDIIVSHDAFEYLGARYDIHMNAIAGLSPEQEPSANRLAELTELAEEINAEYIFFEALTSPRLAETIANEVGAQTLVLDPIEGLADENDDYMTLMNANLENLVTAMNCQ